MNIPEFLFDQISAGNAVLFLGAGASKGTADSKGQVPPDAKQLGNMLSDKFLGSKFKELPLSQIGDLAISESSLSDVQQFIHDILIDFNPASFHKKICRFWWHGIATTNYDLMVERIYKPENDPVQSLVSFIANDDRVDERMRDPKGLMFLKLHGCITRIVSAPPLVLSVDQYITCRQGRERIYHILNDWAYEHPIVFVGHSLQDLDLRAILLELEQTVKSKPRYYIVAPEVDDIQKRFWEGKKVTVIEGTFEKFLELLNAKIPAVSIPLQHANPVSLPISERFVKKDFHLSYACMQFLQSDVTYVKSIISTPTVKPTDFYKGFNLGWGVIEQQLDVRRELSDVILSERFLIDESEHLPGLEMILIKAPAGSGKTILMQRLAWEASRDYDKLCIFLQPQGIINTSALQELITLCNERIFLFVDNAADYHKALLHITTHIKEAGKHLTIVLAERTNEWNTVCGEALNPYITHSYNLKYLSPNEIEALLTLLGKYHALGVLEHSSPEDRTKAFIERAGRQLLVALHEATLGKPFEEIIVDEFNNISPQEAQRIYLTVCVLNRLGIPVRAGIISRVHGVPFEEFKQKFFAPLEQVIKTAYNPVIRDYEYAARHQHIAEIVFDNILKDRDKKFDFYLSSLKALNLEYRNDRRAFRQMVSGRILLDLFPEYEMVKLIYQSSEEVAGEDAYLLHQMGIYEMHRPNGNLEKASEYLSRAGILAPYDITIKHSKAELQLKLVTLARTPLEKERHLKEAAALAVSIKSAKTGSPHAFHTLVKIGIIRLRDHLCLDQIDPVVIQEITKEIEEYLFEGLQQFPGDPYLCEAESTFANLLFDSDRALKALEKALSVNPRNTFIALRLAGCYQNKGDSPRAKSILKVAIDVNNADKRLHYAYAKILMLTNDEAPGELAYHLRRAFTEGDINYDAQLLYGRQLFIDSDVKYKEVFRRLSTTRVSFEEQTKMLYPLKTVFHGSVVRMESTHCFILRDGYNDWIFTYQDNISPEAWIQLKQGVRVSFKIAFTMRGPASFELFIE